MTQRGQRRDRQGDLSLILRDKDQKQQEELPYPRTTKIRPDKGLRTYHQSPEDNKGQEKPKQVSEACYLRGKSMLKTLLVKVNTR